MRAERPFLLKTAHSNQLAHLFWKSESVAAMTRLAVRSPGENSCADIHSRERGGEERRGRREEGEKKQKKQREREEKGARRSEEKVSEVKVRRGEK